MGLIDRIFRKNAQTTPIGNTNVWGMQQWFKSPYVGKFSDVYFYSLINKMFGGLDNSRFINNGNSGLVDSVKDFLNDNAKHLIWNYWRDGIIVVDIRDLSIVEDYRKDKIGAVTDYDYKNWVVIYSDTYTLKRLSTFDIIKNELCFLDRLGTAEDFLTSTYGSVCLITGKTMPMSTKDKEDLNLQLKTSLGITPEKQQFIISQSKDLSMEQFNFDLAGLNLEGKIRDQYLLLADYFNIPKNILTTDTDSTYENQNAALKRFYTDCISPLCEVLLRVGKEILIRSNELIPTTDLSFTFDNVDCLSTDSVFIETINGLLEIASNDALSASNKARINDIITKKIEEYI
jgi:hypothetical protein